jgi:hypothetical protein
VDPDKITQIFCPHCRKGVAVHGDVPSESECPHCKKSFPTGEYAAPRSHHRIGFTSSSPPGGATKSKESPALTNAPLRSLDSSVHSRLRSLNALVPPALFWGLAGFSGCLAPLIDGRPVGMGTITSYSTLAFLYLVWLRTFGRRPAQKTIGSFLSELSLRLRHYPKEDSGEKLDTLGATSLTAAAICFGVPNLLGLLQLTTDSFIKANLTSLNWPLRWAGFSLLVISGCVFALSRNRRPGRPTQQP